MDDEVVRLKQRLEKLEAENEALQARSEQQGQTIQELNRDLSFQNVILEQSRKELTAQKRELSAKTRELEQNNQYKDEFLATLSHELRTPLNALMILTGLLLEGEGDEKPTVAQKESLKQIEQNSKELLSLINTILDMSEMVAGRLQIHRRQVPLTDVTSALCLRYEDKATAKGLQFSFEQTSNIPANIDTDPVRLMQILDSLLDNAIRHTDSGFISLSIDVTPEPDAQWLIRVKDTGTGIPADAHKLIFEPFHQVDGGIKRSHDGIGTGLAFCKKLVELMGGSIQVKSEPGQGAEFIIYLPVFNENKD